MKIVHKVRKRSKDIINDCKYFFNCSIVSETLPIRKHKFLNRYAQSDNVLCNVFTIQP